MSISVIIEEDLSINDLFNSANNVEKQSPYYFNLSRCTYVVYELLRFIPNLPDPITNLIILYWKKLPQKNKFQKKD